MKALGTLGKRHRDVWDLYGDILKSERRRSDLGEETEDIEFIIRPIFKNILIVIIIEW
jgi:hypothetical protein